jgi:lysophospholipase L1-like esterase
MLQSKIFLALLISHFIYIPVTYAKSKLMVTLGDSISAGTLADTSLRPSNEKFIPGALDAEIQELKSKFLYENKSTLAWPSGKKIQSHYIRLSKTFPSDQLTMANLAVPGSKAQDLSKQLEQLFKLTQEDELQEIAYITLLIGANDVCSTESREGTPNQQFATTLDSVFQKLSELRQTQPIRILVSAIPRIPDLGLPEVQNSKTIAGISCQGLNSILKTCSPMIQWQTPTEYSERLQLVIKKNEIIQNSVLKAREKFQNLDIHFTARTFQERITPDLLAADCFHPNQKGHEAFAQKLWEEQPWF